jgi:hypothetical protein
MADEPKKKIIVDDDWKAQARQEKEKLSEATRERERLPDPSLAELMNLIVMQAIAALGLMAGPGGERFPVDLQLAKHFIDMLQVLDDKTRNNLTPEEKRMLDQALYEMRMRYVQASTASGGAPPGVT